MIWDSIDSPSSWQWREVWMQMRGMHQEMDVVRYKNMYHSSVSNKYAVHIKDFPITQSWQLN